MQKKRSNSKRPYSDGNIHRLVEGQRFRHIDAVLDAPSQYLGSRHRQLFHTNKTAVPLACITEMLTASTQGRQADIIGAAMAAILHVSVVDKIPTKHKQLLELLLK